MVPDKACQSRTLRLPRDLRATQSTVAVRVRSEFLLIAGVINHETGGPRKSPGLRFASRGYSWEKVPGHVPLSQMQPPNAKDAELHLEPEWEEIKLPSVNKAFIHLHT